MPAEQKTSTVLVEREHIQTLLDAAVDAEFSMTDERYAAYEKAKEAINAGLKNQAASP
jgi:hypothetical protein